MHTKKRKEEKAKRILFVCKKNVDQNKVFPYRWIDRKIRDTDRRFSRFDRIFARRFAWSKLRARERTNGRLIDIVETRGLPSLRGRRGECEFREIQYSEFNVDGVIALLP